MAGIARLPSARPSSRNSSIAQPQAIGAVKIVLDIEGQTQPASPETPAFTVADENVIEQLKARLGRKKEEHADD